MDEYKVKQLQLMLEQETGEGEHYGARLSHHAAGTKVLTIDAGGLRALINYYEKENNTMNETIRTDAEALRDDLLVTAGVRAGHMEAQNLIELPGDSEGEHTAAIEIAKAADLYIGMEDDADEPWDCYIEGFLESHFPAVQKRQTGLHGLPTTIIKLCEIVYDLAYTAGEKVAKGSLAQPDDSRGAFSAILDLAVKFDQNFDDSGDYLEDVYDYAEEMLPPTMRSLSGDKTVVDATYVTIWDAGSRSERCIKTPCKVDMATREVFDIGTVDVSDVDILEREFIILVDGTNYDVCCAEEVQTPGIDFWHH